MSQENPDVALNKALAANKSLPELIDLYNKTDKKFTYQNPNGFTSFHIACGLMRQEFVEFVLSTKTTAEIKILVNKPGAKNGYTPIHLLVKDGANNAVKMAELLYRHGANLETRAIDDSTPLHLAVVAFKETFISKFLIPHRANIFAERKNSSEKTPLDMVCVPESDVHTKRSQVFIREELFKSLLRDFNFEGALPLHAAVKQKLTKFVHAALSEPDTVTLAGLGRHHRENINVKMKNGMTALHIACTEKEPDLELISVLLQAGADATVENADRETPYDLAKRSGNPRMLEIIEPYYVKVCQATLDKFTSLQGEYKNLQLVQQDHILDGYSAKMRCVKTELQACIRKAEERLSSSEAKSHKVTLEDAIREMREFITKLDGGLDIIQQVKQTRKICPEVVERMGKTLERALAFSREKQAGQPIPNENDNSAAYARQTPAMYTPVKARTDGYSSGDARRQAEIAAAAARTTPSLSADGQRQPLKTFA